MTRPEEITPLLTVYLEKSLILEQLDDYFTWRCSTEREMSFEHESECLTPALLCLSYSRPLFSVFYDSEIRSSTRETSLHILELLKCSASSPINYVHNN